MTPEEIAKLESDWKFWARDEQLPPDELEHPDWFLWMILAGRGFGKTWTGANWVNDCARSGDDEHIALVGRDAHDVRSFMIEGESGILKQAKNDFYPDYEPSKKLITYPNGCQVHIYYAESPKTIRGPNHSKAWADEVASWQDAHLGDSEDTAWSNLMMTCRKGSPKILVTGTPKPLRLVKQLIKYPNSVIVKGDTFDNKANLSKAFFKNVVSKYIGTRLGRQELSGEILDDNPGALWKREFIEGSRLRDLPGDMDRIVVGVDPSVSGTPENENEDDDIGALPGAECGIVVAAKRGRHFYILDDKSLRDSPAEWAKVVISAYRMWMADKIVAERNNGGAMVDLTIRNTLDKGEEANIDTVWASRGKVTRAEPIAALYEQNRVHHVGTFETLEDQLCQWEPGQPSPDRLDALVWALTELSDGDLEVTEGSDDQYESFWNPGMSIN